MRGTTFSVDVKIDGVTDLASYQFDIGFDSTLIHALTVLEGPFLPSAGPTLFVPGTIDISGGTVSFTAAALAGVGPGANGTGLLATIEFTGVTPGTSSLTLLSPLLYDSVPNPIPVTTTDATVTITDLPEPDAFLLVASGFAMVLFRRHRGLK
jgi:hypothetical protein